MAFTFNCSKCGKEINFKSHHTGATEKCWQCGTVNTLPAKAVAEEAATAPQQAVGGQPGEPDRTETRYTALRMISAGYKWLAYIIGIGGVCLGLAGVVALTKFLNSNIAFAGYADYSWVTVVLYLPVLAVVCFKMIANSEAVKIFIDIEENTRISACALKNIEFSLKK